MPLPRTPARCAARSNDPARCATFELTAAYFVEAWDFNGRTADAIQGGAAGVSVPFHGFWSAVVEGLVARVRQRGPDAVLGGGTGLVRRWLGAREGATAFFVEGGFGVSYASRVVPENGTRFNYLLQAGGGATRRFGTHAGAILDLRLFHLSNNSLHGSGHNPDIEALGGHLGLFVAF